MNILQLSQHQASDTPMTTFQIPPEYQKLSIKKAAILACIPRTSFIRKFMETGQISVQKDSDGTDFISFDELYRVFGEEVTRNLRLHMSGHTVQTSNWKNEQNDAPDQKTSVISMDMEKLHKLELELVRTQGERDRLESILEEKNRGMEERQAIIQEQKEQIRRYFDELQTTRRLLEDKSFKKQDARQENAAVSAQQEQIARLEQKLSELSEALAAQEPEKHKGFWAKLFGGLGLMGV